MGSVVYFSLTLCFFGSEFISALKEKNGGCEIKGIVTFGFEAQGVRTHNADKQQKSRRVQ